MRIKIDVTAEDIAKGKRNQSKNCPVRHALLRHAEGKLVDCHVDFCNDIQSGIWWSARVQTFGGSISFDLPENAVERINAYDRGGEMKPFSFEVVI